MKIIRFCLVFVVMQAFTSAKALAELKAEYDPFSDETEIKLFTPRSSNKFHTLAAYAKFPGKTASPTTSVRMGFHNYGGMFCPRPGILADGVRFGAQVEPNSLGQRLLGATQSYSGQLFNFNFFTLAELRTIVNANETKYKLCDSVFILSPQEKDDLRSFIDLF